jgi:hypothetical protein
MYEQKEKQDEYHSDRHFGVNARGRIADLAAQREVGVRPKRRGRLDSLGSSHPGPDGSALTSGVLR